MTKERGLDFIQSAACTWDEKFTLLESNVCLDGV